MPCTTPGTPRADRGATSRLDTDEPGLRVDETREDADRVGPAAHACHHHVRVGAGEGATLLAGFVTDHAVELAHHPRIRVRAHHRTEAVVGVADGGDPVAHRLVDGVLEGARSAVDGFDLGAEQAHAEHVERLPLDVDSAHVHLAVETHQRGRRGGGHTVLPGARLGDQPGLAHPLREQGLAEHVVDLVRAGVVEVFALHEHADAQLLAQAEALGQHRRAPGVVAQDRVQLVAERGVGPGDAEALVELLAGGDQRLGHEAAAELAEPTGEVWFGHDRVGVDLRLRRSGVGHGVGSHSSAQSYGMSSGPR